jgi:capsular polysaccharide biosynthesis protein
MFPENLFRDAADNILNIHIQFVYASWISLVHVFFKKMLDPTIWWSQAI